MLVFEDLHWADDGLLDFVDHLVDWASGVPLLVLCTARPELLDRRPDWGGGKRERDHDLALAALRRGDGALVGGCSRSRRAGELEAALLARAGGNPLYAEEYVRMLRRARRGGDSCAGLPETVQGIIAARLDALPPDEKRVLQDAAVVGKVFWLGAVAAIGERRARGRGPSRARAEGVRPARAPLVGRGRDPVRVPARARPRCRLRADPARRAAPQHRARGDWIESLAAPAEDQAEMLAHHYLSALESRSRRRRTSRR